jgi:hypothetical protein
MLESGDTRGKCADLNALYVGLTRSVGLPARHVYGLRIAKSELGYKSLGLATNNATKGEHCRVEVYLREHGLFRDWQRTTNSIFCDSSSELEAANGCPVLRGAGITSREAYVRRRMTR